MMANSSSDEENADSRYYEVTVDTVQQIHSIRNAL
jgi:hypothetical protein